MGLAKLKSFGRVAQSNKAMARGHGTDNFRGTLDFSLCQWLLAGSSAGEALTIILRIDESEYGREGKRAFCLRHRKDVLDTSAGKARTERWKLDATTMQHLRGI